MEGLEGPSMEAGEPFMVVSLSTQQPMTEVFQLLVRELGCVFECKHPTHAGLELFGGW